MAQSEPIELVVLAQRINRESPRFICNVTSLGIAIKYFRIHHNLTGQAFLQQLNFDQEILGLKAQTIILIALELYESEFGTSYFSLETAAKILKVEAASIRAFFMAIRRMID
jgi:hypothetical protein